MGVPIRMIDLSERHAAVGAATEAGVLTVLRSGRFIGGPVVAEAEQTAARLFGRALGVGVSSGTDALILSLQALGIRPGDEVIVPAISFFATAGAVLAVGAVPVVVDVGPDACIDPSAAQRAQTARTRALIAVHLFGTLAVAPDLGVPVIDDSAQAVGGTPTRSGGILTAVSTYPTKTWGAAGDGGFVVGDDAELLRRVRELANHGLWDLPHVHRATSGHAGRNSRLDALQAAVLVAQAPDLPRRIARRRQIAERYDAELPFEPLPRDGGSPVHHYVVRHRQRDAARATLHEDAIETAVYYPIPLHRQPALERYPHSSCPTAEAMCPELLALPVHEGLSDDDVARVIAAARRAPQ